jgi:hypothetical protein
MFLVLKQALQRRYKAILIFTKNCIFLAQSNTVHVPDLAPKGKRALVVGTGPSVDTLNADMISRYDAVYLINNAIENPIFAQRINHKVPIAWYTADTTRFASLHGILKSRHDVRKIFAPFLDQDTILSELVINDSDIALLKVSTRSVRTEPFVFCELLHSSQYKLANLKKTASYVLQYLKASNTSLPLVGQTSALSLTLFLAKLGYKEIDLIGCDFSSGRASVHASLGSATFDKTDTVERFYFLSKILSDQGLIVRNLSWEK